MDLRIDILGVNSSGGAWANSLVTSGRELSWLQDTPSEAVWDRWEVVYRDVRILDSQNRLRGVFNLTSHDLASPENRETLKRMLREAAQVVDADADGLPDDWEELAPNGLQGRPEDDSDQDGRNRFTEFAVGSDPGAADFGSPLVPTANADGTLSIRFPRRSGSWLSYVLEVSPDMKQWSNARDRLKVSETPLPRFDGSGISDVTFLYSPRAGEKAGFARLRVLRP